MTSAQTLADVAAAYLLKAQARADLLDSSDRAPEAVLHDAFAGLPNRVLMLERLEHAFLRGSRSKISAVFFVALDGFTAVNDTQPAPCRRRDVGRRGRAADRSATPW
jgi:GGDEF domain-containing protein